MSEAPNGHGLHDLTAAGVSFMESWNRDYPETPPINYHFKRLLPKRWIRIHSLPISKRYAEDAADWAILLARQNAVIDYLLPPNQAIQWVWNWLPPDSHIHTSFDLVRLGILRAKDDEAEFESWLLKDNWQSGTCDIFLTLIADDSMRAFIIAPDCLISPYDGGVDVILKDPHTAHAFKRHFAQWVSPREDGL
jgi:hypothetical protein